MKNQTKIIRLIIISLLALTSCINNSTDTKEQSLEVDNSEANTTSSSSNTSTFFKEVSIGKQVWMSENLNVERFRNGDIIPEAKSANEWKAYSDAGEAAWCYYNNDPANGNKYGKLYNWYAVKDPRGLVPMGWHVPTAEEWNVLTDYLGGAEIAGAKMRSKDSYGTNSSGFSALLGGYRSNDGTFYNSEAQGDWWSSSDYLFTDQQGNPISDNGVSCRLNYNSGILIFFYIHDKGHGFSVRCIKD
jgi:uncharacterized protein (TIGR02145 family)